MYNITALLFQRPLVTLTAVHLRPAYGPSPPVVQRYRDKKHGKLIAVLKSADPYTETVLITTRIKIYVLI